MTCIVGIQHEGRVYIGGDSAGVAGYSITSRADAKVFTNGGYVMGFTSSFRMGQLLRYAFKAPKPPARNLDRFMVTTFIDAMRDCYEKGGFLTKRNEVESGGSFLVGVGGQLYQIDGDHQIGRSHDGYLSVGCGEDIAYGSLFSTSHLTPRRRVRLALEAAAHHSAGVAGPFVVRSNK